MESEIREMTEREFNRILLGVMEHKRPEELLANPEIFAVVSGALKDEVVKEFQHNAELDAAAERLEQTLNYGDGLEKPVELTANDFPETGGTTTANDIALSDIVGNLGGISDYLREAGYRTLGDVKGVSAKILKDVRGVGPKTITKIDEALKDRGLRRIRDMRALHEKA